MNFLFAIYLICFFSVFLLILYLFIKSICFILLSVRNFFISSSSSGDILSSCPVLRPDFLLLAAIPSFIHFTVIFLSCSARINSSIISCKDFWIVLLCRHYNYLSAYFDVFIINLLLLCLNVPLGVSLFT